MDHGYFETNASDPRGDEAYGWHRIAVDKLDIPTVTLTLHDDHAGLLGFLPIRELAFGLPPDVRDEIFTLLRDASLPLPTGLFESTRAASKLKRFGSMVVAVLLAAYSNS
jgi:hypothetical protein